MTNISESSSSAEGKNPAGYFSIAAIVGLVVAVAPLVFLDIGVSWAVMFISIPIGVVIALAGFATSLVNAARTPDDGSSTNLGQMTAENSASKSQGSDRKNTSGTAARQRWHVSPAITTKLLRLNIIATVVVTGSTVINVGTTISGIGIHPLSIGIMLCQFIPVPLAVWLLALANRTHEVKGTPAAAMRFVQLERVQRVVGIGSVVWFFLALLFLLPGLSSNNVGVIELLAGLAPTVTGIVAMVVTDSVLGKMEVAASHEKSDADVS